MRRRISSGTAGWVALAGLVVGYDAWAIVTERETMTAAFGRALHHPLGRWPVTVAWAVTTLHLFGGMPHRLDPFHVINGMVKASRAVLAPLAAFRQVTR